MKKLSILCTFIVSIVMLVALKSNIPIATSLQKGYHKLMNSSGITGVSTAGCNCHGPTPTASVGVTLSGLPTSPIENQTYTLTLNVSGTNPSAGYNLAASTGTLSTIIGNTDSQIGGSELTHTAPKLLTSGIASFSFEWTAPPVSAGTVTFTYAGNNVNGGGSSGDFWNRGSVTVPLQTLPVKLSSFTAITNTSGGANLFWTTVLESNFEKYVIEQSCDGINFSGVGEVLPTRNTIFPKQYTFTHTGLCGNGNTFYRLKIVNTNGSNEYSSIVTVRKQSSVDKPYIYPNPVGSNATSMYVYVGVASVKQLQIITMEGQQVHIQPSNGLMIQRLVMPNSIAKNNYYVIVQYQDGSKATLPLLVQ